MELSVGPCLGLGVSKMDAKRDRVEEETEKPERSQLRKRQSVH